MAAQAARIAALEAAVQDADRNVAVFTEMWTRLEQVRGGHGVGRGFFLPEGGREGLR